MEKINIQITKAKLESFDVTLKDDMPSVMATIGLYTDSGKPITTYTIQSNAWDDAKKFDVPPSMVGPILLMAKELEKIVAAHCRNNSLALGVVANDF